MDFFVGVDEVGRGPIAGPVSVCAVTVPTHFDWSSIPGVTDSKRLSEKQRERIHGLACQLNIQYAVTHIDAEIIDTKGIVPSINEALAQSLSTLSLDFTKCKILLDGGLRAPEKYMHQQTIIRGDASEKIIGLASVLAKVERDRIMCELALMFPKYGFEKHKGYGTKAHYQALAHYGMSKVHRKSFIV